MPRIKAKPIRLIDILNTINENEIVKITYNHGRNTYSQTSKQLETIFEKDLGTEVIAVTSDGGTIRIFI